MPLAMLPLIAAVDKPSVLVEFVLPVAVVLVVAAFHWCWPEAISMAWLVGVVLLICIISAVHFGRWMMWINEPRPNAGLFAPRARVDHSPPDIVAEALLPAAAVTISMLWYHRSATRRMTLLSIVVFSAIMLTIGLIHLGRYRAWRNESGQRSSPEARGICTACLITRSRPVLARLSAPVAQLFCARVGV